MIQTCFMWKCVKCGQPHEDYLEDCVHEKPVLSRDGVKVYKCKCIQCGAINELDITVDITVYNMTAKKKLNTSTFRRNSTKRFAGWPSTAGQALRN